MATLYYAYPASSNMTAASTWSNSVPTWCIGSRSTTTVTLTIGDTSAMAVGMTVTSSISGTATSQGTVSAIVSSTQFRTTISGTIAAGTTFSVRTPATVAPTLNDDCYIPWLSNFTIGGSLTTAAVFNCRNFTCDPVDITGGTTSKFNMASATNGYYKFAGSCFLSSRVTFSAANQIIFASASPNCSIYQDPGAGTFSNIFFLATTGSNGIQFDSTIRQNPVSKFQLQQGTINVNGQTVTVGNIVGDNSSLGSTTININGGSFSTATTSGTVTPFSAPYGNVRTINGAITINSLNRSVATIDTGSLAAPATTWRCSFIWKPLSPNQIAGTVYASSLDMSGANGTIQATTMYLGTLNMPTNGMSGSTINFDVSGGTLTYGGGAMPTITINHSGTTTTTNTIGSDANASPRLNLTSGRLALAAGTTFNATEIAGSGTTARGFDFGAGSLISAGSTAGNYDFSTVTNFTTTGTFNIQGGTTAKNLGFGDTVSCPSAYWPNYTSRVNGDKLFGDWKNIDCAGFVFGSGFARTIRCKSIINTDSAGWSNVTLKFSGTGPYSSTNSNQFADIQTDTLPATITFSAGSTITVTDFTLSGTAGNLVSLQSSVSGSQFNLSKSSGAVTSSYLSLKDVNATGGATWTANFSTFLTNVTGWLGNTAVFVRSQFMAFF